MKLTCFVNALKLEESVCERVRSRRRPKRKEKLAAFNVARMLRVDYAWHIVHMLSRARDTASM